MKLILGFDRPHLPKALLWCPKEEEMRMHVCNGPLMVCDGEWPPELQKYKHKYFWTCTECGTTRSREKSPHDPDVIPGTTALPQ